MVLPARLLICPVTIIVTIAPGVMTADSAHARGAAGGTATRCDALTLSVQPGEVPAIKDSIGPARPALPGSPTYGQARDIPPAPVIVHLPLYPGAYRSPAKADVTGFQLPPSYRKVARAGFAVRASSTVVYAWYRRVLPHCGVALDAFIPPHSMKRPEFAGLVGAFRAGLGQLGLTLHPAGPHLTRIAYLVQVLDLPPRPAASYLHGPFIGVNVIFHQYGPPADAAFIDRYTITWPPTIARLVVTINRLKRIAVATYGVVGTPGPLSTATLSFVRRDGGIRTVWIGRFGHVVVGKTRPLDDTGGRVEHLVLRLTRRRRPTPCP